MHCFMITCCDFGAIKFYQLEVQCNFPVYLNKLCKIQVNASLTYVTVRNFFGFAVFLKNQSLDSFYDQYRDFFHLQKVFTVMIWFLMLFDTFLLEKVFSTICFLQLSYDNNFLHVGVYFFKSIFFHVGLYFFKSIYVPSKSYLMQLEITII